MGLLDIFKRKNFTFADQTNNKPGKYSSFYGSAYNPEIDDLYRLAYPNISVIARRASTVGINVTKVDDEEFIYAPDNHWLAYLLSDPNKSDTYKTFMDAAIKSSILFPNTFIIFSYQSTSLTTPISMRVASYNEIQEDVVANVFKGWKIREAGGKFRTLDPKEVLHIKEWNPVDSINGFAPINAAYQFLTLQQTIYLYQRGVFSRPIPAGGYVIEANDADFKDITGRIMSQLKDPDSANIQFIQKRPGTQQDSVSFVKYAQDNRSLAMSELFDNTNQRVDDAFGVPKQMKGDVEATNLAGVRVADSVFMDNVVIPKVETIVEAFNNWLQGNFPKESVKLTYNREEAVDPTEVKTEAETLKIKAETVKIMKEAGISTSKIAELTGLELEFDEKPTEVQQGTSQSKKLNSGIKPLNTKSIGLVELSQDERAKYTAKLDKEFTKHLKKLQDEVLGLQTKSKKAIEDINQIDIDKDSQELYDALLPIFIAYMSVVSIKQFNEAVDALGSIPTTGTLSERTKSEFGIYLFGLIKSWHKDTAIDLANISNEAVNNVVTYQEARKDIINYFSSQGEYITSAGKAVKNNAVYRADRLIRTETIRSGNYASIGNMKKIQDSLGVIIKKVWARTRSEPEAICDHFNGKTVEVSSDFWAKGEILDLDGKNFTNDYLPITAPPAHPNCQCIIKEFNVIGG